MDNTQSVVQSQVTLAVDPEQLPPPPPGFQWARLDDVIRRSLTGSENENGDHYSAEVSVDSNGKIDLMVFLTFGCV